MKRILVAVVAGLALVLTACSSPAPSDSRPVRATLPLPSGVQDPHHPPTAAAGGADTCNARASYRPTGTLPAPGAMPTGSTMAAIVQRGRLRVGVDQNTYLFGYRNPATGEIEGFDIDVAKDVAGAIFGDRNKVQLVAITASDRIPYLQKGLVDLVADTMTMNCDRWTQVNFSSQYFDAYQAVLVPRAAGAKSAKDLAGQKVCAAAGSTSIQKIAEFKPAVIPVAVNDWTDCLVLLQQGQVAAISTDNTILSGLKAQDPTTVLLPDRLGSEPYGLAMAKSAIDFTRFVNGVLDRIRSDGTWQQHYQHWLSATATPPVAQYRD